MLLRLCGSKRVRVPFLPNSAGKQNWKNLGDRAYALSMLARKNQNAHPPLTSSAGVSDYWKKYDSPMCWACGIMAKKYNERSACGSDNFTVQIWRRIYVQVHSEKVTGLLSNNSEVAKLSDKYFRANMRRAEIMWCDNLADIHANLIFDVIILMIWHYIGCRSFRWKYFSNNFEGTVTYAW